MAIRKNNTPFQEQSGIERNEGQSAEQNQVNDEGTLDSREISHNIEEGDEDYDDEELDRGNLRDDLSEEDKDSKYSTTTRGDEGI